VIYKQFNDTESHITNIIKLFTYDPSDTYKNSMVGKAAILTFCPKMMINVQVGKVMPVNKDSYYSKALPSNIDYERVCL
jgi:hypothetical protein